MYQDLSLLNAPTKEAIQRCELELAVLIYIGRSDRLFHQNERDLVSNYLEQRCPDLEFDLAAAIRFIRRKYPEDADFNGALEKLEVAPAARLDALAAYCVRLVQADGHLSEEELESLETIRLSSFAARMRPLLETKGLLDE